MLRKAVLASLLGLAAAAPYSSAELSHGSAPHHRASYGTAARSANGTATHVTITDHVTVTDHVTATDASCAAPTGGNGGSGPLNSYASQGGSSASGSGSLAAVGTPTSTVAPTSSAAPPPAQTLYPASNPSQDANNVTHLAPATSGNLYYSHSQDADTSMDHMFASLDMQFKAPAVVLENSAFIKNVTCSTDGLGITFNSASAFAYAQQQWSTFGKNFTLVSFSDGCKTAAAPGTRTFWSVQSTQFDQSSQSCDVKCTEIGIQDAVNRMTASWGSYAGANSSSPSAASSTMSAPASMITSMAVDKRWNPFSAAKSAWSDATSDAVSVFSKATSDAASVVSKVTSGAESVISKATSAVESLATQTIDKSFTMSINASPTATATNAPTNWAGAAADELISVDGMDIYAVNCYAKGNANVAGTAVIDFLELKITSGTFSLNGSLDASLGMGINAPSGASFSPFNKQFNLIQIPLSPLEIPEIITLGPYVNLDASFDINMEAAGNMMASVEASMPNFQASVDLEDSSKNSQSGFEPTFTPTFHAAGEITLSATFGLPITLGIGLDVPKFNVNASVSLTNTPSMTGYANYSNTGPCADGIGYGLHFNDATSLDVVGLYSPTLSSWASPDVLDNCYHIGSNTTTNSTSTSTGLGSGPTGSGNSTRPTGTGSGSKPTGTGSGPFPSTNGTAPVRGPSGTAGRPGSTGTGTGAQHPGSTGSSTSVPYVPVVYPNGTVGEQPVGGSGNSNSTGHGSGSGSGSGSGYSSARASGTGSGSGRPKSTGDAASTGLTTRPAQTGPVVPLGTGKLPFPHIPLPHGKNSTMTSSTKSESSTKTDDASSTKTSDASSTKTDEPTTTTSSDAASKTTDASATYTDASATETADAPTQTRESTDPTPTEDPTTADPTSHTSPDEPESTHKGLAGDIGDIL